MISIETNAMELGFPAHQIGRVISFFMDDPN